MKHLFIINPAAGSHDRTKSYSRTIRQVCEEQGLDYTIAVSAAPGNCRELAHAAAETGEDYRIYACGGDGTLNEVVSGTVGYPNAAVSVFSGGTGNDFTKIFSEPDAFRELPRLLDADEADFDLISCNGDVCLNICSVGLDARIAADVTSYKRIPLLTGIRAYAVSTVFNLIRGISDHYVVQIGDETVDARQTLICACNGRYYGGGFNPVPDADPTDGLMDVLLIRDVNILKVARVIGKFKNGQYAELPELIRHLRTDHLRIVCDKVSSINIDGEMRQAAEVDIRMMREKIRFFYPKGLVFQKAPVTV